MNGAPKFKNGSHDMPLLRLFYYFSVARTCHHQPTCQTIDNEDIKGNTKCRKWGGLG